MRITHRHLFSLSILVICCLFAGINATYAQNENIYNATNNKNNKEIWNFQNVDIATVVKRVSEETGKNFILDPRVQGQVTIISQQAMTPDEVYQVFLSVLRVHGFKAIEANKVVKIIPNDGVNTDTGRLVNKPGNAADQQIVKIIGLKYISPNEILTAIRNMIPATSKVASTASTNYLIVADTASNIQKVEQLIAQVDKKSNQAVEMVTVQYAVAKELVNTLNEVLKSKTDPKASLVNLASDERTNRVLISGGTPEIRAYIKELAKKLDSPLDSNANSEVIYLKYVQASNIAPIVAAYLEEAISSHKEEKVREGGAKEAVTTTVNNVTAPTQVENYPNHLRALKENSMDSGSQGMLFNSNENQPKSGIINRYVQWEGTTNALIIKAPPTIMHEIRTMIAKLDIRRPQVLIEVIIAEVGLDRLERLGVDWNTSPNASVKFGTRFFNNEGGLVGGLAGGNVAELASGITVGVFRHGDLRAIIRALAADTSTNILSTPTLVTLDNQTALIKVGQKVPFAIGQTNNQNVGGNPFTSFDREEVGLSLTIKPQIINKREIKLQIENILSNVIPNTGNVNTGGNPTTSERTIVTNVLVNEGKILVLGGLIQDEWRKQQSAVPFLGRLPWVGVLFRRDEKQLVKKNLMIFLRPKIMYDDASALSLSTKKYDETRQTQVRSYDVLDEYFVDEPPVQKPLGKGDYYTNGKEPRQEAPEVILPSPFGAKS